MSESNYRVRHLYQFYGEWLDRLSKKEKATSACNDQVWYVLDVLTKMFMPSGSGIDNGTKLCHDTSKANRLRFTFGFHFMDEHGFYDGWEDYKVYVDPSLANGFNLTIRGKNRNDILDYLTETYSYALSSYVAYTYNNQAQNSFDRFRFEPYREEKHGTLKVLQS